MLTWASWLSRWSLPRARTPSCPDSPQSWALTVPQVTPHMVGTKNTMAVCDLHHGRYLTRDAMFGGRISMKELHKRMLTPETRTAAILLSGSPIMWEQLSVASHPGAKNIDPFDRPQYSHPEAVQAHLRAIRGHGHFAPVHGARTR